MQVDTGYLISVIEAAFPSASGIDRPHARHSPAKIYDRSARVYRGLEELTSPFHERTFTVTQCGRICFEGRKVNLSYAFAGQNVGVKQHERAVHRSATASVV